MTDTLDKFLFENRNIRGQIVTLQESYQSILSTKDYPSMLQSLLGELLAATSLLTASIKFEGEVSLQIQSEGAIKYAVVNSTHDYKLKGVAQWDETLEVLPNTFKDCFIKGVLAITLTPKNGKRYQGMVSLDQDSLAECIENYFLQSEQLLTTVVLNTDTKSEAKANGFLVQVIPTSSEATNVANNPDFEHVSHLAKTISAVEILHISHQEMLYRLFHEDKVRLLDAKTLTFECDCSRQRCANALKSLDKSELLNMVKEEGTIKMDCQFCHTKYEFDAIDVENIHSQNLDSGSA